MDAYQNDLSVLLDFFHQLLEALLKLTTVLSAGNQQTHVKSNDLQQQQSSMSA